MIAPRSKNGGSARRLAAMTLVFWLAGLGCVIGCEGNAAAVAPADESQVSPPAESCPSNAGGRDCCHHAKNDRATASIGTPPAHPNRISCCPLAGQAADPARKVSRADAPLAVAGNKLLSAPDSRIPVL